jgi:uncharacterized protein (DUF2235 family)
MQLQIDAIAKFHVQLQDKLTQPQDNANVQLIKKEIEEYGVLLIQLVTVHQNFHFGTVNIALFVQQELNSIQKKNNAIIAQKDL